MSNGYVIGLIGTSLVGTSPSVVLNDTGMLLEGPPPAPALEPEQGSKAIGKPTVQSVIAELEAMESRRKTWQRGAYRQSNVALYKLLAECLAWVQLDAAKEHRKARQAGLSEFLSTRGYDCKQSAQLATKIVRAVFGNLDRRIVSTYSLVIRTAQTQCVKPSDMVQWIEDRGGIQNIKLGRSQPEIGPKQRAALAAAFINEGAGLGLVKTEELSKLADADKAGGECVLVAYQRADGQFAVRALVRSRGAINAALVAHYCEHKDEIAKHNLERDSQQRLAA
jgi:hypothetical protein